MTKKDYIAAANIVKNIDAGDWDFSPLSWATPNQTQEREDAMKTAEVFLTLFEGGDNPHFDRAWFLQATGLVSAPAKDKRASR